MQENIVVMSSSKTRAAACSIKRRVEFSWVSTNMEKNHPPLLILDRSLDPEE